MIEKNANWKDTLDSNIWYGKEQGLDRRGKVCLELYQQRLVNDYPLVIVRMYDGQNPLSRCLRLRSYNLYGWP